MLEYINLILMILIILPVPFSLWQVVIGFFGVKRMKIIPESAGGVNRFAVIICAHNEQAVIGQLIDSLNAQNYSKELYKIFVVADNCTDKTAQVSKEHGAAVYERVNDLLRGKGYALTWMFEKMDEDYKDYFDAYCVFDADNLVDRGFLLRTNDALCNGADVTQGYRDTKNPYDSVVSGCYTIYWLLLMRFFHCARANLGLSCMICGTGYAFKKELLTNGWECNTLTEDIEFSIKQIIKGKKIVPVRNAVFYDEQPSDWKTSYTQRFRWLVGNLQCANKLTKDCFKKAVKGSVHALDMTIFLTFPFTAPVTLVSTFLYWSIILYFRYEGVYKNTDVINYILLPFIIGIVSVMLISCICIVLEKKPLHKYLLPIAVFPVFILQITFMSVAALFRQHIEWKTIKHERSMEIEDLVEIS